MVDLPRFNGLFLGVREGSDASPSFQREYAKQWADEVSAQDPDMGWFVLRFGAGDGSFGITFSDRLRSRLGFDQSHYDFVGGDASTSLSNRNGDGFDDARIEALEKVVFTDDALEQMVRSVSSAVNSRKQIDSI